MDGFIQQISDIYRNIETLEFYLERKGIYTEEYQYWERLIKRGKCFVVYRDRKGEVSFIPSRFVGYKDNTLGDHSQVASKRTGSETTRRLDTLLGSCNQSTEIEKLFVEFCEQRSITYTAREKPREYWDALDINLDVSEKNNKKGVQYITESRLYRNHRAYETGRACSTKVKNKLGYICQVCDFDFKEVYGGNLGGDYIEAHHLKAYADVKVGDERILNIEKDFAVLCANCHRMAHRMDDPSDIDALKSVINAYKCTH